MVLLRSKWLHLYQIDSFVCRTDFHFVLKWFTALTTFRSIKFCRWDLYTFCNTLAKLPALYKTLGVRPETSAKRPATAVEEYTKNKMSNTNRCHSNSFHIRHSRWAAKYSLKGKKRGTSNQQRWGKTTFIGTNSVSVGKYSPHWSAIRIQSSEMVLPRLWDLLPLSVQPTSGLSWLSFTFPLLFREQLPKTPTTAAYGKSYWNL